MPAVSTETGEVYEPAGGWLDFVVQEVGPDGPGVEFVELEDEQGRGVSVGEWVRRDDGWLAIRLPRVTQPS